MNSFALFGEIGLYLVRSSSTHSACGSAMHVSFGSGCKGIVGIQISISMACVMFEFEWQVA